MTRVVGAGAASKDSLQVVPACYYGTTRTMSTLWSSLKKMENEVMLKIVMGEEELDRFDSFVERWEDSGGSQIVEEVKAEIGGR